jgi:hypothetical protein
MNLKAIPVIAFLAITLLTLGFMVLAQDDEQPANETQEVRYMFVQTASSGSFAPVAGNDTLFTLTLEGVSPETIAFSDRPERVVRPVAMQQFLDSMGFNGSCPPNAAIEILDAKENEDLAVAELFAPVYDAPNQTLQYSMRILEEANLSYAEFNERNDKTLPATFGPAVLFIDDCPDCDMICAKDNGSPTCGYIRTGQCWCWVPPGCWACKTRNTYIKECAEKFGKSCYAFYDGCAFDCNCPKQC